MKADSRQFINESFPDLIQYPRTTSRKWEPTEQPHYRNNWWFKFHVEDLEENEFVIFAGARDYSNISFQVFRVPSSYLLSNLDKIDMTAKGWINLYVHIETHDDVRNSAGLSFGQFAVN